eukprot:GHVQ01010736.1.p1 GENE.GHVQ01010736.1~~GHVQ01010736.1.p1  ORF type:complete len:669 (+),score=77.11 GHVQ01010736.1:83-2089(+)
MICYHRARGWGCVSLVLLLILSALGSVIAMMRSGTGGSNPAQLMTVNCSVDGGGNPSPVSDVPAVSVQECMSHVVASCEEPATKVNPASTRTVDAKTQDTKCQPPAFQIDLPSGAKLDNAKLMASMLMSKANPDLPYSRGTNPCFSHVMAGMLMSKDNPAPTSTADAQDEDTEPGVPKFEDILKSIDVKAQDTTPSRTISKKNPYPFVSLIKGLFLDGTEDGQPMGPPCVSPEVPNQVPALLVPSNESGVGNSGKTAKVYRSRKAVIHRTNSRDDTKTTQTPSNTQDSERTSNWPSGPEQWIASLTGLKTGSLAQLKHLAESQASQTASEVHISPPDGTAAEVAGLLVGVAAIQGSPHQADQKSANPLNMSLRTEHEEEQKTPYVTVKQLVTSTITADAQDEATEYDEETLDRMSQMTLETEVGQEEEAATEYGLELMTNVLLSLKQTILLGIPEATAKAQSILRAVPHRTLVYMCSGASAVLRSIEIIQPLIGDVQLVPVGAKGFSFGFSIFDTLPQLVPATTADRAEVSPSPYASTQILVTSDEYMKMQANGLLPPEELQPEVFLAAVDVARTLMNVKREAVPFTEKDVSVAEGTVPVFEQHIVPLAEGPAPDYERAVALKSVGYAVSANYITKMYKKELVEAALKRHSDVWKCIDFIINLHENFG